MLSCMKNCGKHCHKKKDCSNLKRADQERNVWECSDCNTTPKEGTIAGRVLKDLVAHTKPKSDPSRQCPTCLKALRTSISPLICKVCDSEHHKSCAKISRDEIVSHVKNKSWICQGCKKKAEKTTTKNIPDTDTTKEKTRDFIDSRGIRVLQWNADGIKSKMTELANSLIKHKIDIGLIPETKLQEKDDTPTLDDYAVIRKDRAMGQQGGGLIILVKSDIPFKVVEATRDNKNENNLESIAVEIKGTGKNYRFVNLYMRPDNDRHRLNTIDLLHGPNVYIGGDLNGHALLWDNIQESDARGEDLVDWLQEKNMGCCNDGTPTRINRATGRGSSPDISFCHNSRINTVE